MDIKDQVEFVNEKLKNGSSITKIEKELKLGKDTLRKRLNKQGYRYNKDLKKFEFNSDIQQTKQQSNTPTKTQTNKETSTNKDQQKYSEQLTLEEIKFLKSWIMNKKKLDQEEDKKILSDEFKATTLEIEVNLYKKLEEYCYENKETKKAIINKALLSYLE